MGDLVISVGLIVGRESGVHMTLGVKTHVREPCMLPGQYALLSLYFC